METGKVRQVKELESRDVESSGEETEKGPRWRRAVCLVPLKKVIILPNWACRDHLHLHLPQDFTPIHFQLSHLRIFKTSPRNNFLNPWRVNVASLVATLSFFIFYFFSRRSPLRLNQSIMVELSCSRPVFLPGYCHHRWIRGSKSVAKRTLNVKLWRLHLHCKESKHALRWFALAIFCAWLTLEAARLSSCSVILTGWGAGTP